MSINIKKGGKLVKIAPTSYNELTDLPNIESSGDVTYITDESGKNVATIGPGGLSTTGIVVDSITLDGEDVGTKLDSIKGEIDFNDLTNNPISDNNDGTVSFADENGNKIVLIDSEGVTSVEFKADGHKLTEKADQSYVEDQITRLEASAFSGDYNDLENAPIINDTTGSAVFADDQGNQIAKIDAEGVTSIEFIAGTHKLTNKAEKDALLADFTEDSEHQTVTSAEKTYWSNKSEFSGKFGDLTDSPIIDDNSGELIYTDGTNTIVKIDASGITTTNVAIKEGDVATLIGEKADQTSLDATNNTLTATNATVSTHTTEIDNLKTEVANDKTALETFKTETAGNFTAVNKSISDTNDAVDVLENKVSINEEKLEGVQASDGEFTITDGTNIGMKLDSEGLLHVREVEVAGGRVDERLKDIENYFSTEEDADSNLNKWHEIVDFLNGFEETDQVLENIINTKADKTTVEALDLAYKAADSAIRVEMQSNVDDLSTLISNVESNYKAADAVLQIDINKRALQTSLDASNKEIADLKTTRITKDELAESVITKEVNTDLLITDAITLNEDEFVFADPEGYKIAEINDRGITSTDFIAGTNKLTEKADKSYVDDLNKTINSTLGSTAETIRAEFAAEDVKLQNDINTRALQTSLDATNQKVSTIESTYATKAEIAKKVETELLVANDITLNKSEYVFSDANGNKIAQIDSAGINSTEFVSGDHKLTLKADKTYVDQLNINVGETISNTASAIRNEFKAADTALQEGINKRALQTALDSTNQEVSNIKNNYVTKAEIAAEVKTEHLEADNITLNQDNYVFTDGTNKIAEIDSTGVSSTEFTAGSHQLTKKADTSYVDDQVASVNSTITTTATAIRKEFADADSELSGKIDKKADQTAVDAANSRIDTIANTYATKEEIATEVDTDHLIADRITLNDDTFIFTDNKGDGHKIAEINSEGVTSVDFIAGNKGEHKLTLKADASYVNDQITALDAKDVELSGKITTVETNYKSADENIKLAYAAADKTVEDKITALENSIGTSISTGNITATGTIKANKIITDDFELKQDSYQFADSNGNKIAEISSNGLSTTKVQIAEGDVATLLDGKVDDETFNNSISNLESNKVSNSALTETLKSYALKGEIPKLDGYLKEIVADGKYATITATNNLSSRLGTAEGNITSVGNRVSTLEGYFATEEDADDIINKWTDVVEFLDGIAEGDTDGEKLEAILAAKANQTSLDATNIRIDTIEDAYVTKVELASEVDTEHLIADNITARQPEFIFFADPNGYKVAEIDESGITAVDFIAKDGGRLTDKADKTSVDALEDEISVLKSNKQDVIANLSTIISNAANGATAYGWGNHASAGYLKKATADETYAATDANPNLTWGTKSKVATVCGTDIYVTMPANPNTDMSCTESGHYPPSTEASANKQSAGSGKYISGIKLDSKKHVVGIDTGTLPSFTESCKGTVTSVTPGIGLKLNGKSDGDSTAITGSGTIDLQVASSSEIGGIKIGYTTSGQNYPVQLDSNNKAYVYVPWTDTDTWRSITDSVTTTSSVVSASATAVKKAYDLAATKGSGTVTSITPGTGLTNGTTENAITSSGTLNLKTASSTEIGGIKTGYSESGKNYAVKLDSNNKAYVNVPWTDTNTDTNTTYTFADGTNCFYVTPSGGTQQTVNVTPSIANNITGSGTNGYLAKFNGTNSITGIAMSNANNFLNGAGSWTNSIPVLETEQIIDSLSEYSIDLDISGVIVYYVPTSDPIFTITQGSIATTVDLTVGGSVSAPNGFYQQSDERLKDFGLDIQVDLEKIKQLPKKYFVWNSDETKKQHIGTSAQAVQEIYPELVNTDKDGKLSVAYDKLSIIALKAVDELYDKNKELEARIERLEKLLIKE